MAARSDYDVLVALQCVLWCVMRCDVIHYFSAPLSCAFLCRSEVLCCVVVSCTVSLCVLFFVLFLQFFSCDCGMCLFVLLCRAVLCCVLLLCNVLCCSDMLVHVVCTRVVHVFTYCARVVCARVCI